MRYIISTILICYLLIWTTPSYARLRISIRDAIDKRAVNTSLVSLGGHTGPCLELQVKNISTDTLMIFVEPGREMVAGDSVYQNILVTRADSFQLVSGGEIKRTLIGMCMQMHDSSPVKDAKFTVGKMAGKMLVSLAEFLSKHNYQNETGQYAVWVLSDNNPAESVHSMNKDPAYRELQALLHRITGKPVPWYTLEYKTDTATLFTGKPIMLYANFIYYIQNNGIASLLIYDAHGKPIKEVFVNQPLNPGNHDYPFVLEVATWKAGKYSAKLFIDDRVLVHKEIEL